MPDELEPMDCADLVELMSDMAIHGESSPGAKEQFRAQLVKLIDERIALAMEKGADRSGVAYRLHGDARAGMRDHPRGQP